MDSAAGLDGITYRMINTLNEDSQKSFLTALNRKCKENNIPVD